MQYSCDQVVNSAGCLSNSQWITLLHEPVFLWVIEIQVSQCLYMLHLTKINFKTLQTPNTAWEEVKDAPRSCTKHLPHAAQHIKVRITELLKLKYRYWMLKNVHVLQSQIITLPPNKSEKLHNSISVNICFKNLGPSWRLEQLVIHNQYHVQREGLRETKTQCSVGRLSSLPSRCTWFEIWNLETIQ